MSAHQRSTYDTDVFVLGATPGGIAAAIAAARLGQRVLVAERSAFIGGLPANGLGVTDITTRAATGGIFDAFIGRIRQHYHDRYGADSEAVELSCGGYRFEPSLAASVFAAMLAEHPQITILRRHQFDAVAANVDVVDGRLRAVRLLDRDQGRCREVRAAVFIDAGYEGDLAAAAGAPFRIGRESADAHGEPGAGRIYWDWDTGELLPGSTGEGDAAVQAYNYRFLLTRDPALRVAIARPTDYRREDYLSIIDDVQAGRLRHGIYRYPRSACAKPVPLPNGVWDTNDHPRALISTDLAEENWPYPTADWAWRDRYAQRLRDYELGLLWFCQHDDALPAAFREDCQQWGLPRSEFADNGHFPRQLYVREARRIEGEYLFTACDCIPPSYLSCWRDILTGAATGDPDERPPLHRDSITASHYPLDSHPCHHREPDRDRREGYFAFAEITRPYQVPYGVIVPRCVDGLLTPVPASATHMGFSTLRMEPCWMALGQAAGTAAALAVSGETTPRAVTTRASTSPSPQTKLSPGKRSPVQARGRPGARRCASGLLGPASPERAVVEVLGRDHCDPMGRQNQRNQSGLTLNLPLSRPAKQAPKANDHVRCQSAVDYIGIEIEMVEIGF
jgi:hypothetical protein